MNRSIKKYTLGLVICLLLSSFFYSKFLLDRLSNGTLTLAQLEFSQQITLIEPTKSLLIRLIPDSVAWLNIATITANTQAESAYQLALYYLARQQNSNAQTWLYQATRLKHPAATVLLAKRLMQNQQSGLAQPLLLPIVENPQALMLLAEIAMEQGNIEFLQQHQQKILQQVPDFYQELMAFQVFERPIEPNTRFIDKLKINSNVPHQKTCVISIQLFATNLPDLRISKQLVSDFSTQTLAQYVCLAAPWYIPIDPLQCQHQRDQRIECSAQIWQQYQDIDARYIAVMLPEGQANVDTGLMYLDRYDTVEVLSHEISHLLGFIDEYPLPEQHEKCSSVQQAPFAHNVAVLPMMYRGNRTVIRAKLLAQLPWGALIKESTPLLHQSNGQWRLGTPEKYQNEVGVFTANTCEKGKFAAFKPLAFSTALEYFELPFSAVYLDLLSKRPQRFLMPSFHYNVSRALAQQDKIEQARILLNKTRFD